MWSHDGYETDARGVFVPVGNNYCDQNKAWSLLGTRILEKAWGGLNTTLFAYGQTGSGKSYSMVGYPGNKGIVPLVCEEKRVTWADGRCGMFEGATPFNQPVVGNEGLQRPLLASGDPVTGSNKKVFRKECKRKRVRAQEDQPRQSYWSMSSRGQELKETFRRERPAHVGGMCPAGPALKHPASDTLMEWAT